MKQHTHHRAGLWALAGLLATASAYADRPDPREIQVRGITAMGTGCPSVTDEFGQLHPSALVSISEDASAFTVLFDQYVVESGPGVSSQANRKNCQLLVDLKIPQGWQFSIFNVDYYGYTNLDPGLRGVLRTQYRLVGSGAPVNLIDRIQGPTARDYHIQHKLGVESVVWSACGAGKQLTIGTAIGLEGATGSVQPGNRRGLMTVDSIDGVFKQVYGIQWRRCP